MEKGLRRQVAFLSVTLLLILFGFFLLALCVTNQNKEEKTIVFTSRGGSGSFGDVSVAIAPRGGITDSWLKLIPKENAESDSEEKDVYAGYVYSITVTNLTESEIRDWTLRVNIDDTCMINNAWCGQVEFHQTTDLGEAVQTLDLRELDATSQELSLDFDYLESDFVIPMKVGDYFIYHPSADDGETILKAADSDAPGHTFVQAGFIVYYNASLRAEAPKFRNLTFTYQLHRSMTDFAVFPFLAVLFVAWWICLIACTIVHFKMKRFRREMENDARIIKQTMLTFMEFIDAKDPSTNGHSKRVAGYAKMLAQKMGLPEEEVQQVYYIALMHDCGKIAIPDAILNKPGELTREEYEIIKTHTTEGNRILHDFNSIPQIRDGVLHHHERYDGAGYPDGLAGEAIPLVARIICVADSFDAMNSDRCYRSRLTKTDIETEIRINKGKQFDPKVADCLLEILAEDGISCLEG